MNCGPAKKSKTVYSYTGTEDGDFVIWKGETFIANVGASAFAETALDKQQIAFDVDRAHAELIVNALNGEAYPQGFLAGAKAMQEAAVSAALNCEVTLTGDDPFGKEPLAAAIRALDPEKVGG